jgi:hypothetical protein
VEGNKQPGSTVASVHGFIYPKREEILGKSCGGSGITFNTFRYFGEFLIVWPCWYTASHLIRQ